MLINCLYIQLRTQNCDYNNNDNVSGSETRWLHVSNLCVDMTFSVEQRKKERRWSRVWFHGGGFGINNIIWRRRRQEVGHYQFNSIQRVHWMWTLSFNETTVPLRERQATNAMRWNLHLFYFRPFEYDMNTYQNILLIFT